MKNPIIIILLCSIGLFSCKKSFLTLTPQSQTTDVAFYKTTADITNAVTAAYEPLQTLYMGHYPNLVPVLITMMETRSDNVEDLNPGGNAGTEFNIDRFLAKSDNTDITTAWQTIYTGIERCNIALSHLDVVTDSTLRSRFEGELKFLWALHYFNIVRMWGAAPLELAPVSTADARKQGRNSVQELYTAIESDLTRAAALLPATYASADLGRATQGAAKALLGKVYLTELKYAQAVNVLKDLVGTGTGNAYGYSLLPAIADVFNVSNKMNAEVVFAVRYNKTATGEGHALPSYFNQPGLDPKLIASYEPADTRKDLLTTVTLDANNKPVKKYYDTFDPNTKAMGGDFLVLRYSDVLLMYAEALNEVGYSPDALTYLNAVRARAGASTYTASGLPDQVSFRTAVLNERRLELPLELHRWFDLVRTNTAIDALKNSGLTPISIQAYQYLYPVPQSEINIMNNATTFPQNQGY